VQRIVCCLLLSLPLVLFLSARNCAGEQALTLGYGFAALNAHTSGGEIEGGKKYDFLHVSYLYENPRWKKASFIVEPFAAYIIRPTSGVDGGFDLLLRWYPFNTSHDGLFLNVGAGIAYTSIGFQEQGTHLLGVLAGGIGYRYKSFFIEDRFRHYSNGHTSYPNRSVNANIISVGMYF
jgi:hypothetical protein